MGNEYMRDLDEEEDLAIIKPRRQNRVPTITVEYTLAEYVELVVSKKLDTITSNAPTRQEVEDMIREVVKDRLRWLDNANLLDRVKTLEKMVQDLQSRPSRFDSRHDKHDRHHKHESKPAENPINKPVSSAPVVQTTQETKSALNTA